MSPQVNSILQQIEHLSETDRLFVEQRLRNMAEAEWLLEAKKARAVALELGVDQPTIDKAVEDVRYGT